MNASTLLQTSADTHAARAALVFEGRRYAYGALWEGAGGVAAQLCAVGVAPGDRVALLLPNVPAFAMAFHGVLRLGAIAVCINPSLTAGEVIGLLDDVYARRLVTTEALAATLDRDLRARLAAVIALPESGPRAVGPVPPVVAATPQTPAAIIFSSGTTGQPKGVTLSHGNLMSNVQTNAAEVGMTPADRVLLFMPLFHCYGLNVILNSALSVGATVVMERRFDPRGTAATIEREQVTMFFGVPTTFIVLLQSEAPDALASLRYCYCAAAPLPLEIEARWTQQFGLIVNQAYGLSEASPCVAYNAVGEYRPGSIGKPSAGVQVRVVDPDSEADVEPGAVGEFWVKGPGVMLGYWGRPEATAATLRDGWLRTGDLGRCDADGYLYLTDRLKDMINCGGMKVFPTEVENAIYRHPAVGEAAVVGVPDSTMGEVVHAQVAPKPGQHLDVADLRALLVEHLAAYKRPTLIRVVGALPKGRTGKILRRAVRVQEARCTACTARPVQRWTRQTLQAWIVDWLQAELSLERRIQPDLPFVDAGVDSLLAVRKAEALSALLGRPVPATVTWLHPTPERLAAFLVDGDAAPPPPAWAAGPLNCVPPSRAVDRLSDAEAEAELLAELLALDL